MAGSASVVLEKPQGGLTAFLDRVLTTAIEGLSAVILVVEVGLLFCGVLSRYVFQAPILWIDEVTLYLFVWLSMLGAAIGLRRHQHMRLTVLIENLSGRMRDLAAAISTLTVLVVLAALVWPAATAVQQEMVFLSPGLGIPAGVRLAGIAVGICLMLLIAVVELVTRHHALDLVISVLAVGAVTGLIWLARDWLTGLGAYNLLVYFALIITICVFLGVPIAFAFSAAILAYISFATHVPLQIVIGRMDEGLANPILLAVPLFCVLGALMETCGLARTMIQFLVALLCHVRGGFYYVLLGAMYLISGISGAKVADMAAIVPVLFPEMKRQGYRSEEMVSILAASGAMAETIPPSLVLITVGSVTGVSIAALFMGGLLPALVIALALGVLAYARSRHQAISTLPRASPKEVGVAFLMALPALGLPFVIRTAVVEGVATATEVSTVGIVYTLLLGVLSFRNMKWSRIYGQLVQAAILSGSIMLIIAAATAVAWGMTQSGFSRQMVTAMTSIPGGHTGFILVSIVAFTCLGSILEGIPALVLFGPLLFPVAKALGVHEVHYAMIVILAMGVGLFAPPFGVGFYIACALGETDPARAMKPVSLYLATVLLGLLIVAAVPWLATGFLDQ